MTVWVMTTHEIGGEVDNFVYLNEDDAKKAWHRAKKYTLDTGCELVDDYEDDLYFRDDHDLECYVIAHHVWGTSMSE